MTVYAYNGDDSINNYYFYPNDQTDELIANFFAERDELITVRGLVTADMGADNDYFRGYVTAGNIYLGAGNDEGAGAVIPESGETLSIYGQNGDDALEVFRDATNDRALVRLYGGSGVDALQPSPLADYLDGGEGFDFIGAVSTYSGGVYRSLVTSDTIVSVEGQDGSAGNDLITPWGTDRLTVSGLFVQVGITQVRNILQGGQGGDTLQGAGESDILIGNAFRQFQLGMSNFRGSGSSGDPFDARLTDDDNAADNLIGEGGNDFLDGGGGADTLDGGAGIDTASFAGFQSNDNSGVSVDLLTGANTDGDTLISIENLVGSDFRGYSGSGNDTLSGNAGANVIAGRSGADILNGQGGRDTLYGDSGNDRLIDADGGDTLTGGVGEDSYEVGAQARIVELAGQGSDTVTASASFALTAGQEIEALFTANEAGTTAVNLTGNEFANTIRGNAGANVLNGMGGADTMTGLAGSDTYFIDNAGDRAVEAAGGGTDTIYTVIDFALGAGQEIEYLRANAGSTGLTLTGNELANRLVSGAGGDTLAGGAGSDVYYVNGAADVVQEAPGSGSDVVYAASNYTLASGQEVERLTANAGGTGLRLTGNDRANEVLGGTGADTLEGGGGNDRMLGGAGDDVYVIITTGTVVTESANSGTDTVQAGIGYTLVANVENLTLTGASAINGTGNGLANVITGNVAVNTLQGGDGADTIVGGAGADRLYGNAGADTFVYKDVSDSALNARDGIYDFVEGGTDKIDLSAIDANQTAGAMGDQAFTLVSAYTGVAGQLRSYSTSTLTYAEGDVNGDRKADFQIVLSGVHSLQQGDFVL